MVPFLKGQWPESHLLGLDSSAEMLGVARESHPSVEFVQADFSAFSPGSNFDFIFSNAALHWHENHTALIPQILSWLSPGGVFAMQIPDTTSQPSHLLIKESARRLGFAEVEGVRIASMRQPGHADFEFYYELLSGKCLSLDMWNTTYCQVLEGSNPVPEFVRSTGLIPVVQALGGEESEKASMFLEEYSRLVAEAYSQRKDGKTLFPFKRFFMVVTMPL